MSQHLAALEAEIGEALFIRAPRKMLPTDKGKELYTKIVPLIENLENTTLEMLHSSSGNERAPVIRIGSPAEYFTIQTLPKIRELNIRFLSQFGVAGTLLEKLEKDEVDLILTTQKVQQQGIEYQKLEDEVFVAVVPPTYETSAAITVEKEEWLNKQNWLSYGLELPIIRRYWRDHFKKRPDFQPCHVIPDLRSILEGIENGLGMSILPTYLVEKSVLENRVKVLFPELNTENTIYASYKVEHKNNPVLVKVLEALKRKN